MSRNMERANAALDVFVTGSRSQLGAALLPRLVARGDRVTALARTVPSLSSAVQWIEGRLPSLAAPDARYDALISFGPMDALADWLDGMATAPAKRVVATSSMSAVSKVAAQFPEDRAVAARLQHAEARLAAACARLGIPLLILRPTMIYGMGLDKNLTPIARAAIRRGIFPAPTTLGLRQPVHADDVAQAALAAATVMPAIEGVLEIGGGERVPVRDLFRRVHASLPRKTLYVPVPGWALSLLSRLSVKHRGAVSRLHGDLVADNRALTTQLGVHPRGFAPEPSTWNAP